MVDFFQEGILEAVTVLVGISVRGQATAGVLHQPFCRRTYLGIVGQAGGAYRCTTDDTGRLTFHNRVTLPVPTTATLSPTAAAAAAGAGADRERRIVTTTRSHMSAPLQSMIDAVAPTAVLRHGGCGGKYVWSYQSPDGGIIFH